MARPQKRTSPAATPAPATPAGRRVALSESASPTYQTGALRVDRQAGVCEDVKFLGLESRNGYPYREAALTEAEREGLYERVQVFIDHPPEAEDDSKPQRRDRPFKSLFGFLEQIRHQSGDGLRAQRFRFNPKHPLAETFCWWAENAPDKIGFSHNAEGDVDEDAAGRVQAVNRITKVHSVDLVTLPATTRGLFESTMPNPLDPSDLSSNVQDTPLQEQPTEPAEQCPLASVMAAVGVLLKSAEPKDRELAAKLLAILQEQAAPAPAESAAVIPETKTEPEMPAEPMGDVAPEDGKEPPAPPKKDKKDTYESLKASKDPAVRALFEQLDRYQVAEKAAAKRAHVIKLCEAARLPKLAVTDIFLSTLIECEDEARIQSLIEDRRAVYGTNAGKAPISAGLSESVQKTEEQKLAEFTASVLAVDSVW